MLIGNIVAVDGCLVSFYLLFGDGILVLFALLVCLFELIERPGPAIFFTNLLPCIFLAISIKSDSYDIRTESIFVILIIPCLAAGYADNFRF